VSTRLEPVGVKALGPAALELALGGLGQPSYRAEQVIRWLYARGVDVYDEMTDLPSALRSELAEKLPLAPSRIAERAESALDGTRKYLVEFGDRTTVEAVGLPGPSGRLTVCFSTQAGCSMGCAFCATGLAGFQRDLLPGEIADQVRLVADDCGRRATNAVAMGQGEPFANYDSSLEGLRVLNHPAGLGIGARHLTVSTCGLISGIRRLAREPEQFTLAVSLHSSVQRTRDRLMPGVAGVPLGDLRDALVSYAERTGRRPSLEYALIEDVNDSHEELDSLVRFCEAMLVHVNLIPASAVPGAGVARSSAKRVREFARRLADAGIESSVRVERGADIDAACGQLRQRVGDGHWTAAATGQAPPASGQSGQDTGSHSDIGWKRPDRIDS
jgi:23S rRNA (adenine2503-C2)-methyltransferase